ncbi:hypothetical protein RRF57_006208 [Xylaria bambusicola]|uniref:Uncharacterized protein n=1 Tax=Xylaria bambusicola TaxID=326684 RepID=A0AAN7UIY9_9PEZI
MDNAYLSAEASTTISTDTMPACQCCAMGKNNLSGFISTTANNCTRVFLCAGLISDLQSHARCEGRLFVVAHSPKIMEYVRNDMLK